jgi:hypothetical protein
MKLPVTICVTYFRSLTLANLAAALYSVKQQDMTFIDSVILVDNATADTEEEIHTVLDEVSFTVPVSLHSFKHGDSTRTHSWSTNRAVELVLTPWVFFTRADYLLTFEAVEKIIAVAGAKPNRWNGFVTGNGCHLNIDVEACECTAWRIEGPRFSGVEYDYTCIDAGVWLARKDAFDRVGGLDESLTAWGHAQTHFQHKLFQAGTEFVRVPEVLFYHPAHGGAKDLEVAHAQLAQQGVTIGEMWARYDGPKPYGDVR